MAGGFGRPLLREVLQGDVHDALMTGAKAIIDTRGARVDESSLEFAVMYVQYASASIVVDWLVGIIESDPQQMTRLLSASFDQQIRGLWVCSRRSFRVAPIRLSRRSQSSIPIRQAGAVRLRSRPYSVNRKAGRCSSGRKCVILPPCKCVDEDSGSHILAFQRAAPRLKGLQAGAGPIPFRAAWLNAGGRGPRIRK